MLSPFKQVLCLSIGLLMLNMGDVQAQRESPLAIARSYWEHGKSDSALAFYHMAYEQAPFDLKIYEEYLGRLMDVSKYEQAIALVEYMREIRRNDPAIVLDLVEVYQRKGELKAANKLVQELMNKSSELSDYDFKKLADALMVRKKNDEVIKLYELALNQGRLGYESELIRLYLEQGEIERALPVYYRLYPYQQGIEQDIRARLAQILQNKPELKPQIESTLKKLSNKDKKNKTLYSSILSWMAQQDGSQAEALVELIAVDKKDKGSVILQIMEVGKSAFDNKDYRTASEAFEYVSKQSEDPHFRTQAGRLLLESNYRQLLQTRPVDQGMVDKVAALMEKYFSDHPEEKNQVEYLWYMDVMAKYLRQPQEAERLLTEVIDNYRVSKEYLGLAKISIGDYQLLSGKVWEANLTYAQVDKLYKQDKLGEEAKYKQALLAFYRGDFEWAQTQLNILKASTTELIANDAMNLSVMITENTVKDTSAIPLKMYAKADLMIFQYQYSAADSILNELLGQYPQSDLVDDIWMLQASMAREEGDFVRALKLYTDVVEQYKDGVLADDAMMKMGEIYEVHLKDKQAARKIYEDLIITFPGSTLAGVARNKLSSIQ